MNKPAAYLPFYKNSWAFVIGINKYQKVSPLSFAYNDSLAIAECLEKDFLFPKENIFHLFDESATKENILARFMQFSSDQVLPDDRLFVFFAGHGHTVEGRRGEVGYLVPVDGDIENLASLIRWDELTRNTELIPAKHILFAVDACYGGLAVNRRLSPGNKRFLHDMLQRYSRQVLAAGKRDQPVSDGNGPIPGNSIFTGHLLQGLKGKAVTQDGILTANKIMHYVYQNVGNDPASQQTPHYGSIDGDGDGDFIFLPMNMILPNNAQEEKDNDILYEPISLDKQLESEAVDIFQDKVKTFLSDSKFRIQLDDLVSRTLRNFQTRILEINSEVAKGQPTPENFVSALRKYENEIKDVFSLVVLLGKFGGPEHEMMIEKIFSKAAEVNEERSGIVLWLGLRWYPIHILFYSACISALSSNNVSNFRAIINAKSSVFSHRSDSSEVSFLTVDNILELKRSEIFKKIPGHERYYTPVSEYTYKAIQPLIEDLLFLGKDYERMFDRFEVLLALIYADRSYSGGDVWGPIGRFGYKYGDRHGRDNPFNDLVTEANLMKKNWPFFLNGFFNGSLERFNEISSKYGKLLSELHW